MQIKTMYFAAVIFFIAMSFLTVMSNNGTITPELQEVMLNASNDELIPVGIFLKGQRHFTEAERTSFNDMPKRFRQTFVAQEIVSFARDRQKNLMNILKEAETQKKCTRISQIEIVNAINCHLTKDVIETISKESEINLIIWDKELPIENTNDAIVTASNSFASLKKTATAVDTAAGVKMIHAPDVWGLGYDGDGVLVAVIDQLGFNYNHPDLANHLWDGSSFQYGGDSLIYHGWDYIVGDNNPYYDHGHGTLCAGIIAGDGTGDGTERIKTGVAPGVSLMLLSGNTEAQWFNCLDFFSDMDSIYGANFQMPDIISMSVSQKFPGYPSYGAWRTACEHLLDLGIVHINSAGDTWDGNPGGCNQGIAYEDPVPYNVAAPANCPPPWLHPDQPAPEGENLHLSSAIAVGFVDASGNTIGSNSARGPSAWENIYAIYPCQDNANIYDEMWDYLYDTADQDSNPLVNYHHQRWWLEMISPERCSWGSGYLFWFGCAFSSSFSFCS